MKYFNENMSSKEAQHILFSAPEKVDRKTFEEIKEEFSAVFPIIIKRELKENDGWLTNEGL